MGYNYKLKSDIATVTREEFNGGYTGRRTATLAFADAVENKVLGVNSMYGKDGTIYLAVDKSPFVLAELTSRFGDVNEVYAPTIRNGRYRNGTTQYYTLTSTNLATAVGKAAASIIPTSIEKQARQLISDLHMKLRDGIRALDSEVCNTLGGIIGSTNVYGVVNYEAMYDEFSHLLATKAFNDKQVEERVRKYVDAVALRRESNSLDNMPYYYINSYDTYDGLHIEVLPISMDQYKHNIRYETGAVQAYKTTGEVPPEIMHKISIMQAADKRTYINNVGYKVNNDVFFIAG